MAKPWCHVNLPWFSEVGQAFKIWRTVGGVELDNWHFDSEQYLHLRSSEGSAQCLSSKENWPGGRPPTILDQRLFTSSMARACIREFVLNSQGVPTIFPAFHMETMKFFHDVMHSIDRLATFRVSLEYFVIPWARPNVIDRAIWINAIADK